MNISTNESYRNSLYLPTHSNSTSSSSSSSSNNDSLIMQSLSSTFSESASSESSLSSSSARLRNSMILQTAYMGCHYQSVRQDENWVRFRKKIDDEQSDEYIKWINLQYSRLLYDSNGIISNDAKDTYAWLMVTDLCKDFSDGIRLIYLLEIIYNVNLNKELGSKSFGCLKLHKIKNHETCLNFLINKAKLKCVGINPLDLVEGNKKMIISLLFLIRHDFETKLFKNENTFQLNFKLDKLRNPKDKILTVEKNRFNKSLSKSQTQIFEPSNKLETSDKKTKYLSNAQYPSVSYLIDELNSRSKTSSKNKTNTTKSSESKESSIANISLYNKSNSKIDQLYNLYVKSDHSINSLNKFNFDNTQKKFNNQLIFSDSSKSASKDSNLNLKTEKLNFYQINEIKHEKLSEMETLKKKINYPEILELKSNYALELDNDLTDSGYSNNMHLYIEEKISKSNSQDSLDYNKIEKQINNSRNIDTNEQIDFESSLSEESLSETKLDKKINNDNNNKMEYTQISLEFETKTLESTDDHNNDDCKLETIKHVTLENLKETVEVECIPVKKEISINEEIRSKNSTENLNCKEIECIPVEKEEEIMGEITIENSNFKLETNKSLENKIKTILEEECISVEKVEIRSEELSKEVASKVDVYIEEPSTENLNFKEIECIPLDREDTTKLIIIGDEITVENVNCKLENIHSLYLENNIEAFIKEECIPVEKAEISSKELSNDKKVGKEDTMKFEINDEEMSTDNNECKLIETIRCISLENKIEASTEEAIHVKKEEITKVEISSEEPSTENVKNKEIEYIPMEKEESKKDEFIGEEKTIENVNCKLEMIQSLYMDNKIEAFIEEECIPIEKIEFRREKLPIDNDNCCVAKIECITVEKVEIKSEKSSAEDMNCKTVEKECIHVEKEEAKKKEIIGEEITTENDKLETIQYLALEDKIEINNEEISTDNSNDYKTIETECFPVEKEEAKKVENISEESVENDDFYVAKQECVSTINEEVSKIDICIEKPSTENVNFEGIEIEHISVEKEESKKEEIIGEDLSNNNDLSKNIELECFPKRQEDITKFEIRNEEQSTANNDFKTIDSIPVEKFESTNEEKLIDSNNCCVECLVEPLSTENISCKLESFQSLFLENKIEAIEVECSPMEKLEIKKVEIKDDNRLENEVECNFKNEMGTEKIETSIEEIPIDNNEFSIFSSFDYINHSSQENVNSCEKTNNTKYDNIDFKMNNVENSKIDICDAVNEFVYCSDDDDFDNDDDDDDENTETVIYNTNYIEPDESEDYKFENIEFEEKIRDLDELLENQLQNELDKLSKGEQLLEILNENLANEKDNLKEIEKILIKQSDDSSSSHAGSFIDSLIYSYDNIEQDSLNDCILDELVKNEATNIVNKTKHEHYSTIEGIPKLNEDDILIDLKNEQLVLDTKEINNNESSCLLFTNNQNNDELIPKSELKTDFDLKKEEVNILGTVQNEVLATIEPYFCQNANELEFLSDVNDLFRKSSNDPELIINEKIQILKNSNDTHLDDPINPLHDDINSFYNSENNLIVLNSSKIHKLTSEPNLDDINNFEIIPKIDSIEAGKSLVDKKDSAKNVVIYKNDNLVVNVNNSDDGIQLEDEEIDMDQPNSRSRTHSSSSNSSRSSLSSSSNMKSSSSSFKLEKPGIFKNIDTDECQNNEEKKNSYAYALVNGKAQNSLQKIRSKTDPIFVNSNFTLKKTHKVKLNMIPIEIKKDLNDKLKQSNESLIIESVQKQHVSTLKSIACETHGSNLIPSDKYLIKNSTLDKRNSSSTNKSEIEISKINKSKPKKEQSIEFKHKSSSNKRDNKIISIKKSIITNDNTNSSRYYIVKYFLITFFVLVASFLISLILNNESIFNLYDMYDLMSKLLN